MSEVSWVPHKPISDYPWWVRWLLQAQVRKFGTPLFPTLMWGRTPFALLLFTLFFRFFERSKSQFDPALRSLIMVRISQINWCAFCVDLNSLMLLQRAKAERKLEELHQWRSSSIFDEREKAALAFAEAVTRPDRAVPLEVRQKLNEHFSADEIVELTALIGYQNFSSKFNYALGIPAQGLCEKLSDPRLSGEAPQE